MTVLVSFLVFNYMVESPRWLNSIGDHKRKIEELKKIAEINNRTQIFEEFLEEKKMNFEETNQPEEKKENISQSIFDLNKFPKKKNDFIVLSIAWFISGCTFYVLIFNLEHQKGNMFIDSLVTFSAELIAEMASGILADKYRRKIVMIISTVFGGIAFILYSGAEEGILKTILIFSSSIGFSSIFNVLYIYSPEVFPTSIRSSTMCVLFITGRLGGFAAPFAIKFIKNPPLIFGLISIFTGVIMYKLDETLGKEMQDTLIEETINENATELKSLKRANKDSKHKSAINEL